MAISKMVGNGLPVASGGGGGRWWGILVGLDSGGVWLLKRREGQQQNPHHRVPHPPSNPQGQGAQKPPGWRHHPPRQCSAQHPPRGAPQEG
ncbi:hypothetical protein EJB05_34253, partial [Eragrostis curvula]